VLTCEIFVNGRFLAIAASPDGNIEYQWFPLCVVRTHTAENLQFSTRMFLPSKHEDWSCVAAGAFTELAID
jgi:hypothetical protein